MTKKKLLEFRADFLLLTVAVSWGVTFLMVQDAIKTVPVYAFLFWRFAQRNGPRFARARPGAAQG